MTAQLLPNVYQQFFGITGTFTGLPLVGGLLYSYQAGTSTPQATYTDETALTANTNPIVLNSVGAANIWMSENSYKFVLTDSLGVVQWTVDNVKYINLGTIDKTMLADDIAGLGLYQDGTGALNADVDNVTIGINGSNELAIVAQSLTPNNFNPNNVMEVLYKYVRDFSDPGSIRQIPQYEWTTPTLFGGFGNAPTSAGIAKWCPSGEFLAVGNGSSAYLNIYQLDETQGTLINIGQPVSLPTSGVVSITWSPCGDFLAVATVSTPWIYIYQKVGGTFNLLPTPSSLPTGVSNIFGTFVEFSPNSDYLGLSWQYKNIAGQTEFGFILYKRGGFLSVTNTVPVSTPVGVDFSGTGTDYYVTGAASGGSDPTITYAGTITPSNIDIQNNGVLFTDITSAAGLSGLTGNSAGFQFKWSHDSSYLAMYDHSSQVIDMYFRSGDQFTGFTAPVLSSYVGDIFDFAWSPDGNFFSVLLAVTPFILNFQVVEGTFTQLSNPPVLTADSGSGLSWSPNSEYLAYGTGSSPYLAVYKVTNPTSTPVFTIQANLNTLPVGLLTNISWHPTKKYIALGNTVTPYVQVYQTASVLPSNAFIWTRGVPNV
jgi:hypothetical protein